MKKKTTVKRKASINKRERLAKARELAATPTTTVTLRVPVALDDWLNRTWRQTHPERLTKKGLVTEALTLLYLLRGEPNTALEQELSRYIKQEPS